MGAIRVPVHAPRRSRPPWLRRPTMPRADTSSTLTTRPPTTASAGSWLQRAKAARHAMRRDRCMLACRVALGVTGENICTLNASTSRRVGKTSGEPRANTLTAALDAEVSKTNHQHPRVLLLPLEDASCFPPPGCPRRRLAAGLQPAALWRGRPRAAAPAPHYLAVSAQATRPALARL